MPYGAFNGVITVALPYLLRVHGLSIERIAGIAALVQIPAIWYFLWAPVVDLKMRRRTWVLLLSVVSAALTVLALSRDIRSGALITVLLIVASAVNQPVSSAIGGLVAAVMPSELRGRTGGWSQAGILGGGILTGGLSVYLSDRYSAWTVGVVAGVLVALPAFAVLAVDEPRGDCDAHRENPKKFFRELWTCLKRRDVWGGFLFFLSPIGAGALMNLFSAIATDFHASSDMVVWIVAIAGTLTPAGALIGGFISDHINRWLVYPIGGFLSAAAAGAMFVAPLTPTTYAIGAAAYAFATGFCYAAFMSLAFTLLGRGQATSGTQFTLFMAAVNLPVAYMVRLDGIGHGHFGVRGMLGVDAAANGIFAVLFLIGIALRSLKSRDEGTAQSVVSHTINA